MQVELEEQVVVIVTYGWTDMDGLAVINYVTVACKKTYFLESVYTGAQAHDAVFLVADIKRIIVKYNFLHVGAVVVDNMATNKSVWELLQPDFACVFFHECVCHALHVFVKDTVSKWTWLDGLISSCNSCQLL
ncbi:Uncharacterized protein PHPALM_14338 [Phytophthora palmivora]|uniref:DUF659 domain-containing protein n=1 Tax=Phytophthora palmivora TaxID=4796 RepID=A0A2P4XUY7_9STRA|nr:Uncharacterized protein PHPALM_14338 [Phytophthora palmivora]